MKIKTKWYTNSNRWQSFVVINIDGERLDFFLAAIESILEPGLVGKKVYIVTDLFGDYHPDVGNYFGEKFPRLKDAKEWVEKQIVEGLTKITKQLKGLGK